jgi:hypothetical protein
MTAWEYVATSWAFYGAHVDGWPKREDYDSKLKAHRQGLAPGRIFLGSVLEDEPMNSEYRYWRDASENDYLNAMGAAGFELVTLHREVDQGGRDAWPVIAVRAYFKRLVTPGQPDAPRNPIGFKPPSS